MPLTTLIKIQIRTLVQEGHRDLVKQNHSNLNFGLLTQQEGSLPPLQIKAAVALGRKLGVIMHRMLVTREEFRFGDPVEKQATEAA